MKRAIAIMAKAPVAGQAKTRLAAVIGAHVAADLHRAFLAQSLATAMSIRDTDVALMCPDEMHAELLRAIVPANVAVWSQTRPGLMAGIAQAFEHAQAAGAETIVVTETDSPTLPADHLLACFELLAGGQPGLVLGPCSDGGYYLAGAVGLSDQLGRQLFEGQAYASDTICRDTAERARALGMRVEIGPDWYDVDAIDDLHRLRVELQTAPSEVFRELRAALDVVPALGELV